MAVTIVPGATDSRGTALSDLLKQLLGIRSDAPVFATPSFRAWGVEPTQTEWAAGVGGQGGLWLIDTRDRVAQHALAAFSEDRTPDCEAALILTGNGPPGGPLRRLLRRIRRRKTRRLPPQVVLTRIEGLSRLFLQTLGYNDGPHVPAEFSIDERNTTGTAILVSRSQAFQGPLWSAIAARLNAEPLKVEGIQLRVRGAAIAFVRAGAQPFVVRVVPPGPFQEVVAGNQNVLAALRQRVGDDSRLLARIPLPAFSFIESDTAVFGETRLPGKLAWRALSAVDGSILYRNALDVLRELQADTERRTVLTPAVLDELLRNDRTKLAACPFVSARVRQLLDAEFESASATLLGSELPLYTSHGDFGYGNILVDDAGRIQGVIDWDTARFVDVPGIDRVNLEIQIRRRRERFPGAVAGVWRTRSAHEALAPERGPATVRALFGLAVCRYVIRSLTYPSVYAWEEAGFRRALEWLARTGR